MSTIYAKVVLGVRGSVQSVSTQVQRFDELTGKPYLKSVSKDHLQIGEKGLLDYSLKNNPIFHEHFFHNRGDWMKFVFGIKIAEVGIYDDIMTLIPPTDEQIAAANSLLAKLGITTKPQLFLVLEIE